MGSRRKRRRCTRRCRRDSNCLAQLLTPAPVRPRQLLRRVTPLAGRRRRQQPRLAPQHQTRRRPPPAAGAPLVVAVAAEELFQVVVGPRQVRHLVAVEQARPVAAADPHEVSRRPRQRPQPRRMPRSSPPAGRPTAAAPPRPGPGRSSPRMCAARHTQAYIRAMAGHSVAVASRPAAEQLPQPLQLGREPLFSATRSRLAATADSRSCNFSPEASSGGRPSSVRALRTASQ